MVVPESDSPREIPCTSMAHKHQSPMGSRRIDYSLTKKRQRYPTAARLWINVDYRVLIKPLLSAGENLLLGNYSGVRKDYLAGARCGASKWVLKTKASRCGSGLKSESRCQRNRFPSLFFFVSLFPSRYLAASFLSFFHLVRYSSSFLCWSVLATISFRSPRPLVRSLARHRRTLNWQSAFEGVNIVPGELLAPGGEAP